MIKVIFTVFVLAAVLCALTSAMFNKPCKGCRACLDIICMAEGDAGLLKAVENQFALFVFRDIPDSIRQQCAVFSKRASLCNTNSKRCNLSPDRPWNDRFTDTRYVRFLVAIGKYSCRDPSILAKLKSCATEILEKLMHTCVGGEYKRFNYTCARRRYADGNNCDGQVDDYVEGLLSQYIHVNPYINESS